MILSESTFGFRLFEFKIKYLILPESIWFPYFNEKKMIFYKIVL